MIQPEPARVRYHAGLDCAAGRHSWCSAEAVPAAGHLGVTEEFCGTTVHEPIDKARKCPFCGAAT